MDYNKLVMGIITYEDNFWFGEYIYFKALNHLKDVRADLKKLDLYEHVKKIIQIFLIQWGSMRRTVDRTNPEVNWDLFTNQIQKSEDIFQKLRGKTMFDINKEVEDAIKDVYNSVKVNYIGPTAISKILHLLNPEFFIMLDDSIREKYSIAGNADGYLKFLKQMKDEVMNALKQEANMKEVAVKDIIEKICIDLPSKKLGQEYTRKTLAKLVDEYNMTILP